MSSCLQPTTPSKAEGETGPTDLGAFLETYRARLTHLILGIVHDRELAEDLTQETFLRAWAALSGQDAPTISATYLYRIATNLCLDHLRRRRLVTWAPIENADGRLLVDPVDLADPEREILILEGRAQVHGVLTRLPGRHRRVLALVYGSDLSISATSEAIGKTQSATKSLLFRARVAFAEAWGLAS
jgi:RNA polymerase sigma-70 factor (ECF subfamily)